MFIKGVKMNVQSIARFLCEIIIQAVNSLKTYIKICLFNIFSCLYLPKYVFCKNKDQSCYPLYFSWFCFVKKKKRPRTLFFQSVCVCGGALRLSGCC